MAYVHLYATDKNNPYGKQANITKADYGACKLFIKYEHRSVYPSLARYIYLYKDNPDVFGRGKYVTIVKDAGYTTSPLTLESVYFNKYEKTTPLITSLKFGDNPYILYYTDSQYEQDYKNSTQRNTSTLNRYHNDDINLLGKLLEENGKLANKLTFEITVKQGKNSAVNHIKSYNEEKINIRDYNNINETVLDGKEHRQKLLDLAKILNKQGYNVYHHEPPHRYAQYSSYFLYNKNVLVGPNKSEITEIQDERYNVTVYYSSKVDIPLLLEFNKGSEGFEGTNFYYRYKIDENGFFFEKFEKKYEELSKNSNQLLLEELEKIEVDFVKVAILLLTNKSEYNKDQVQSLITDKSSEAQPETIHVNYKTNECQLLEQYKYKCFAHDLSGISYKNSHVELKLWASSNVSSNRGLIETYSDWNMKTRDFILYKKGQENLYVYFYDQDPRPILLCYEEKAYKPISLFDYDTKWAKESSINTCTCRMNVETLKIKLTDISDDLNPVDISQTSEYPVHTQRSDIKIKVDRTVLTCYYKYTHRPKHGHRLGKIVYKKGEKENPININETDEKTSVAVYYYKHDKTHVNPLLVKIELESSRIKTVHYKLMNNDDYTFEKVGENDIKGETKLMEQLFSLNKQYNGENYKNPEYENCNDMGKTETQSMTRDSSNNNHILIAVSVAASIATVGGVILIYKCRNKISNCFTPCLKEV